MGGSKEAVYGNGLEFRVSGYIGLYEVFRRDLRVFEVSEREILGLQDPSSVPQIQYWA